jgi:cytochrome P450
LLHTEERSVDFWDQVIIKSEKNDSTGEGLSKGEMVNNASTLVLAGSETSATTLSGAIFLLCKNPTKLAKLVDEIRSAYRSSEDITILSVSQLSYMSAVLDEASRIYPAVPRQAERVTPVGGGMIEGKWVPEHVSISMACVIA